VQIGNWKVDENIYSIEELLEIISHELQQAIFNIKRPGILLSGGIDSSIIAILGNKYYPGIPCFTIGKSYEHPDVISAMKLSKEKQLNHYVYLPKQEEISESIKCFDRLNRGDNAVMLILKYASKFITDILAGDGIDEQMGGYWWHVYTSSRFSSQEETFKYFFGKLEEEHLTPMFNSAEKLGINVDWIYLHKPIVDYISRIPIRDRVKDGIGKSLLREIARIVGMPEWIINRPKRGFVDALS